MGQVIEFPSSHVRDDVMSPCSDVSRALLTATLNRVFGKASSWFAKRKRVFILDRAGLAILMVEHSRADSARVVLRFWNDTQGAYDEDPICTLRLVKGAVAAVLDPTGRRALPILERQHLHDTLVTAEQALTAGSVVRIVN